jgi:ABC-type nitrate/sulfonate/bicarbonate transport system substrate-binding protein
MIRERMRDLVDEMDRLVDRAHLDLDNRQRLQKILAALHDVVDKAEAEAADEVAPETATADKTAPADKIENKSGYEVEKDQDDDELPSDAELGRMTRGELDDLAESRDVDITRASNKDDVITLLRKDARKRKRS